MSGFEIFIVAPPGMEPELADEARRCGFAAPAVVPGGVQFQGDWSDAWRANLMLRGATRVLVRFASFRAMHLAQLDKRARRLDWSSILGNNVPVRVEATCRKSRIYHDGAAAQRIETAVKEVAGVQISAEAEIVLKVRIDDDLCTISVDTSGESLHKRGFKTDTGKAPMRETLAALFLFACGYRGEEPLIDPMCGSGTFVLEAAELAAGLMPGRGRSFAFETLASFDPSAWEAMRAAATGQGARSTVICHGSDRDQGAIGNATRNAAAAGLAEFTEFRHGAISDLVRPDGPPGLVIVNPPYGARIGNKRALYPLYSSFGSVMKERFAGWRVGLVTSDAGLAKATGLPFKPPGPYVPHGGLKIRLRQTGALPG